MSNNFWVGFTKRAYQESSDEAFMYLFKPEKKEVDNSWGVKFNPGADAIDRSQDATTMFGQHYPGHDVYTGYTG